MADELYAFEFECGEVLTTARDLEYRFRFDEAEMGYAGVLLGIGEQPVPPVQQAERLISYCGLMRCQVDRRRRYEHIIGREIDGMLGDPVRNRTLESVAHLLLPPLVERFYREAAATDILRINSYRKLRDPATRFDPAGWPDKP